MHKFNYLLGDINYGSSSVLLGLELVIGVFGEQRPQLVNVDLGVVMVDALQVEDTLSNLSEVTWMAGMIISIMLLWVR